ncbi:hypothetical protein MKZ38_010013 [Zalerion maritima]|uniref:Uncharacterized protein n=1 Tax=Zalerion maritima TaxID=339359 RepID=A0AAD5WLY4_9PEZI|nr:hypothetical protein MKZ38_010013 [Zalerion maritima]
MLEQLMGDSPSVTTLAPGSHYALVMVMISTLSHVTQYALQEHKYLGHGIPWRAGSQYASIDSTLLQLESNFGLGEPLTELIEAEGTTDGDVNPQIAGPLVFARVLFHLCHCLLHHVFLLQQRLFKLKTRAPVSFLSRSRKTCQFHAQALSTVIEDANKLGYQTVSSFYGYCHVVAGTIHTLFSAEDGENGGEASHRLYQASLDKLQSLARYWKSAGLMVVKLERFRLNHSSAGLSEMDSQSEEQQSPPAVRSLWESVDYWSASSSTPPDRNESEGRGNSISPTADMSLDASVFDFAHWPNVDRDKGPPAMMNLRDDTTTMNMDSLGEFNVPEVLLSMAAAGESW